MHIDRYEVRSQTKKIGNYLFSRKERAQCREGASSQGNLAVPRLGRGGGFRDCMKRILYSVSYTLYLKIEAIHESDYHATK